MSSRPDDAAGRPRGRYPRRRLELPFLAGVLALLALVIGAYAVERDGASGRAADAELINVAGRQRMLSQRIALLAERVKAAPAPADAAALVRAARQMRAGHDRLAHGDLGRDRMAPEARRLLFGGRPSLDRRVHAFLALADRVAAAGARPGPTGDTRRLGAIAVGRLVADLDRVVAAQERAARAAARSLGGLLTGGAIASVLALLALIVVVFRPLARRVRREMRTVALLEGIATASNAAPDAESAYAASLRLVCEHTGWPVGHVYLHDPQTGGVRSTDIWQLADRERYQPFIEITRNRPLGRGIGLPGRVVVSHEPVWVPDVRIDDNFPRKPQAAEVGLVSGMAFPVLARDEVVAVIEVFAHERISPGDELLRILHHVGTQLGRVAERARSERELAHRATHDELTGLPNRALLADRIAGALSRARRRNESLAVLFVDLDHFKLTNDTLGHESGDRLLRRVAERLDHGLRASDTVARFGGDEFVVLCESVDDPAHAQSLADRVAALLAEPLDLGGESHVVTASIGIALGDGRETAEQLLRDADTAMYHAKRGGRARGVLFAETMHDELRERVELSRELAGAAERAELRLHLQPIVTLADRRTVGFEGLARWEHPKRGQIAPGAFIPLAEETGLIVEIGGWVLREACRLLCSLPEDVRLSVNVSARQIAEPGLVEVVRAAVEESGIVPRRLLLEVTESAVLDHDGGAVRVLHALRHLGVRVAMDDFGTGYSSLGALQELPLDVLKLDRSFISRLNDPDDRQAGAVVGAVAQLAEALDLQLVAEGVETEEQAQRLRDLRCPLAQGFLYARPRPAEEVIGLAAARAA